MHCQKWDRGKHLRLCKAKAAWPETFAASDAVLRYKKGSSANKCCTELSTRYCYCKISLSALTSSSMWKLKCLCQHLTALLLLNLVQPSLSSGHRRHQAIKGWWWYAGFRGPKKEHLFVAADTISIVSAMIGKEQRPVMSNKDHGATIHTHTTLT